MLSPSISISINRRSISNCSYLQIMNSDDLLRALRHDLRLLRADGGHHLLRPQLPLEPRAVDLAEPRRQRGLAAGPRVLAAEARRLAHGAEFVARHGRLERLLQELGRAEGREASGGRRAVDPLFTRRLASFRMAFGWFWAAKTAQSTRLRGRLGPGWPRRAAPRGP